MHDIAVRAKVSTMTVSLALRDSTRISSATRDRIQALAAKMGYRPDPALRSLVAYRRAKRPAKFTGTIAYVNNTSSPGTATSGNMFQTTLRGAVERGEALGYNVEEFWLKQPGLTPARRTSILRARGIQGLILAPQEKPDQIIDLDFKHFSVVTIGFSLQQPRFNVVIGDLFKSMLLCMHKLTDLGYRRIGLVMLQELDERTQHRYLGAYCAAAESFPHSSARPPVLHLPTLTKKSLIDWHKKYKLDAIIGPTERVPQYLREAGYRVPEDVGFACPLASRSVSQFAHADGRPYEVGRTALEMVSGMIDLNEKGIPEFPRTLLIDPVWVPGGSVRQIV